MSTEKPSAYPVPVNVTLTRVGLNMGDHAQDVTEAVDVDPGMTVAELVALELMSHDLWAKGSDTRKAEPDWYLTIRAARPAGGTQ